MNINQTTEEIFSALDVALQAASMGFPVFPVNPNNKRPLVNNWPNVASCDPEVLELFWTQFPQAMAGICTGHASGYFVLDIDVEEGEDAFEKLHAFQERFGKISETMIVKTPSGGLHIYFVMPE